MLKKLAVVLILLIAVLASAGSCLAQEQVCTSVYGGGVVCGAKHEAVPTALGDVNPALIGGGLLLASFGLYRLSRKLSRQSVSFLIFKGCQDSAIGGQFTCAN